MSAKLLSEFLIGLTRKHKKKARRVRALPAAKKKPAAVGGIGVADAATRMSGW